VLALLDVNAGHGFSGSEQGMIKNIEQWAVLPIRGIVGYGFMAHGYAKLVNGPENFSSNLQALGAPMPTVMSWATIFVELGGGLAVLLGALIPLVSIPLAIVLLTAIFTVHLPYGFSSIKFQAVTADGIKFGPPGYEVGLLYLASLATMVMAGPGPLSVDGWVKGRKAFAR